MIQMIMTYTEPRARRTDPETSHRAADSMKHGAADHRHKILRALKEHGPGSIYRLAELTGLSHVSVARRLPELQEALQAAPDAGTDLSPSGRGCRVWRAV